MKKFMLHWLVASGCALAAIMPASAQEPPSSREASGYSGLPAAAYQGDTARLAALLASKPELEVRDARQRTPLHLATYARRHEAIRMLAAAGADLDALDYQRYDPVTIAAVANDEATLALLLRLGARPGNITSPYDGTALIAAAHLGHVGVVRQLIDAGAPLDHVNNLHWTALIEAIVLGDGGPKHAQVVCLLLAAGASTAIGDRNGNLPIALAKARGYAEMEGMLAGRVPACASRPAA